MEFQRLLLNHSVNEPPERAALEASKDHGPSSAISYNIAVS